jgi:cytochrome P450
MVAYNPYAYEVHEDPYPFYARLRAEAPVYRNAEIGFWALSRYDDVLAAFKDTVRLSNAQGVSLERSSVGDPSLVMSFLGMDPPRHDHMRNLVSRGFTPRRVAELEPRIRELAVGYIERFLAARRCDFIQDFAGRLPMDVVSEMLGVPSEDRDELRRWADLVLHREEGMTDIPAAGVEASMNLLSYFNRMMPARRRSHGSDLVSALFDAEIDGERLTDRDIVAFLFLMIIAGNETTTKLLGNALYWAWRNPAERDKVRRDQGRVSDWVEETLRYDPSTQALARTATCDFEIAGQHIRKDDKVLLLIGSANRDETVFPAADRYDLDRDTTASLAFGRGTHFCLGASLARLEARIALEEVLCQVPDFEIDPAGLVRVHSTNVRGFAQMPIGF